MKNLEGKVAIVTGAGGGLGRAHAIRLAGEGALVVVNDVGDAADAVVAEIEAAGGRAIASKGSVADFASVGAMVNLAVETFGDLDIIVNNAGVLRDAMPFNMTEEQWDLVVDVHMKGHFNLCRHAVTYWRDQHKAGNTKPRRIINTSSEAGLFGSPGQINYASAKGGIVAMTLSLGRVMERYNVTANVIAPRARTSMTETQPLFTKKEGWGETAIDPYDPDHVARVVAWLASDRTHDVSGQIFVVMGASLFVTAAFPIIGQASQETAWEMDDLDAARSTLFAQQGSGMPPWGGPSWA